MQHQMGLCLDKSIAVSGINPMQGGIQKYIYIYKKLRQTKHANKFAVVTPEGNIRKALRTWSEAAQSKDRHQHVRSKI